MDMTLVDYQMKVLQDPTKNILIHGGRGSGKTRLLCMWLYVEACTYPGAKLCMVCNDHVQLRDSTLSAMFEFLAAIKCTYVYKTQAKKLLLPNGSSITMLTFEKDKTSLKGSEWDACGIDEADGRNTTEEKFDYLIDGVRGKTGSRRIFTSCNPVPPGHFLAKRFFVTPMAEHKGYKVSTYDNAYNLPSDYVTRMEAKYPPGTQEHSRWMLGEMVALSGAIYRSFDENNIVEPSKIPELKHWAYGIDLGVHDPMVVLEGGLDNTGILYITGMYYKAGLDITQHIPIFKPMVRDGWPCFTDHSATQHSIMKSAGLNVVKATKDVHTGIQKVSARFISNTIKISTECKLLIEELYNYEWRESKQALEEKPDHRFSHSPDALRYLVMGIDTESLFN